MRTVLQALQIVGIVAPLPAVEGLPADSEVATGQSGLAPVGAVVIEPAQPLASLLTLIKLKPYLANWELLTGGADIDSNVSDKQS
jgi:hypothetical protein